MTRTRKILLGVVALTAIAGGVAAASAGRHGGWGHGGERGHGMGMMGMGPLGAVCRGDGLELADHMIVRIEHRVKPTDAQKPAFDDLKAALKSAAAKAKAGCPAEPVRAADGNRPQRPAPTERLAMMEAGLSAGLDAVRTVRPAAEKFYAALTDEQKAAFAQLGPGGKRGWHRDGMGGPRGPRGADAGEGAAPAPSKP